LIGQWLGFLAFAVRDADCVSWRVYVDKFETSFLAEQLWNVMIGLGLLDMLKMLWGLGLDGVELARCGGA
jgi:hypothetical protein